MKHKFDELIALRQNRTALAGVFAILCLGRSVLAALLHVPADYATIQAAVDAAAPSGDEILITPGLYNQQAIITGKKLTLTGTNGTVLSAWTGMALQQPGPRHAYWLIAATTNADVVVRNIDFEGNRLEQSLISGHPFGGLLFWGASSRVENCTFQGFRGVTQLGSGTAIGFGLACLNVVSTGVGVVNLLVLHNTFADNGQAAYIAGDDGGPPPGNPSLLRRALTRGSPRRKANSGLFNVKPIRTGPTRASRSNRSRVRSLSPNPAKAKANWKWPRRSR